MILVDTSVWIDSFHGGDCKNVLDILLANDEACVNDVILEELLPSMNARNESEVRELLLALPKLQMNVDWSALVAMQTENIRHGLNKVGIPDLMIVQNAIQCNAKLFSIDRHFALMSGIHSLAMFKPSEK
mgnify:CR=1 FL=1